MKECPTCQNRYPDDQEYCAKDNARLIDPSNNRTDKREPPEAGLPVRLTIIDADNEGHKSRTIGGKVVDLSSQGMHIQTSAVESDSLNIIKDHTVAFKNHLDIEIDLPTGTVHIDGFAVWYRPAADGRNWDVGIYIKEMPAADLDLYEDFLATISEE
jgi:hypothetical protein